MQLLTFQIIVDEKPINKLSRIGFLIGIALLALLVILPEKPVLYYIKMVSCFLGIALIMVPLLIQISGKSLYQTNGTLQFSETEIVGPSLSLKINNLSRVKVEFSSTKGQGTGGNGTGPGTGNMIYIYANGVEEPYANRVLIESRAQRDLLVDILKVWRKAGIKVSADGIDLV